MLFAVTTLHSAALFSSSLNDDLDVVLREEGITGITWSLVLPQEGVQQGSVGFRNGQKQLPFQESTTVHVGSVTKAVLATGILRLVTQGLIELDQDVTHYLPWLAFQNPWAPDHPVTVRHLLDHTAGLEDARLWQLFSLRAEPDTPLRGAFPASDLPLQIRTQPGQRFSYSNKGYGLLGLLIEAVTAQRYETYLDQYLLEPLGMQSSTFEFTTQSGTAADPNLAWGHVDNGSTIAAAPVFLRPAGQFTTTAGDMARLLQFLMGDGRLRDEYFISPELMRARGKPHRTDAARFDLTAGYALGLARRDRPGGVGFCHTGNIIGFVAAACFYPEQAKAYFYAANTDSETADYGRIESLMLKALALEPAATPPTAAAQDDVAAWHGYYVPDPNRFAAFRYLDLLFGIAQLKAAGEHLELNPLQGRKRTLRPLGNRLYSAGDRELASHVLLQDNEQNYFVATGFATLKQRSWVALAMLWINLLLGALGLLWLFFRAVIGGIRDGLAVRKRAVFPALVGATMLLVPIPLFFLQSFMSLGDITPASLALALATGLLPVCIGLVLLRSAREKPSGLRRVDQIAAAATLAWCCVLIYFQMIPLRLWV